MFCTFGSDLGTTFLVKYVGYPSTSNANRLRNKPAEWMKPCYSHCKNIFLFSVSKQKIIYMPEAFSEESVREKVARSTNRRYVACPRYPLLLAGRRAAPPDVKPRMRERGSRRRGRGEGVGKKRSATRG